MCCCRIHVVEKVIMKCIVKEYKLDTLLVSLRNIFFLQDESFSQHLCKPLFDKVSVDNIFNVLQNSSFYTNVQSKDEF